MDAKAIFDLYPEPEPEFADNYQARRWKEQCAIEQKYEDAYYELFPDDPMVVFDAECGGTNSKTMIRMWLWALEHRRHWYEWPDLVSSWAGKSPWIGILPPDDV